MRLLYKLQGEPVGAECEHCKRTFKVVDPFDGKSVNRASIDTAVSIHYRESPECLIRKTHDF